MQFIDKYICISSNISLISFPMSPVDNESALVHVMAWHRTCHEALPELMLTSVCITSAENAWSLFSIVLATVMRFVRGVTVAMRMVACGTMRVAVTMWVAVAMWVAVTMWVAVAMWVILVTWVVTGSIGVWVVAVVWFVALCRKVVPSIMNVYLL